MEGCQDTGNAWQEAMVEVYAPKIALKCNLGGWQWHGADGLQLGWDRLQAGSRDTVAEESYLCCSQNTLILVQGKASTAKALKNSLEMSGVSGTVRTGNQNVVKVDENKGEITKNTIHESLKCLGRVLESKRHPKELEQAKGSNHCGFLYVAWIHGDLVISSDEINDRKHSGSCCR